MLQKEKDASASRITTLEKEVADAIAKQNEWEKEEKEKEIEELQGKLDKANEDNKTLQVQVDNLEKKLELV
jgi:hypothetical protein